MTDKNYLDPQGYWGDPSGNIHRMSGDQEIIATATLGECSDAEWKALCRIAAGTIAAPRPKKRMPRKSKQRKL